MTTSRVITDIHTYIPWYKIFAMIKSLLICRIYEYTENFGLSDKIMK